MIVTSEKIFHFLGHSDESALQAALFLSVCFASKNVVTPYGPVPIRSPPRLLVRPVCRLKQLNQKAQRETDFGTRYWAGMCCGSARSFCRAGLGNHQARAKRRARHSGKHRCVAVSFWSQ